MTCERMMRYLPKTMTFATLHMTVAFTVVYAMTGSLKLGGAVALIEPVINTVVYFLHEHYWARRQRRKHDVYTC
jgi:uncharacterized membrane protein